MFVIALLQNKTILTVNEFQMCAHNV